jgi:hypothetical protein
MGRCWEDYSRSGSSMREAQAPIPTPRRGRSGPARPGRGDPGLADVGRAACVAAPLSPLAVRDAPADGVLRRNQGARNESDATLPGCLARCSASSAASGWRSDGSKSLPTMRHAQDALLLRVGNAEIARACSAPQLPRGHGDDPPDDSPSALLCLAHDSPHRCAAYRSSRLLCPARTCVKSRISAGCLQLPLLPCSSTLGFCQFSGL